MKLCFVDIETRSSKDLKNLGLSHYVECSDFDIVCGCVIAVDNEKTTAMRFFNPIFTTIASTPLNVNTINNFGDTLIKFKNEKYIFVAHNATFEYACLAKKFPHLNPMTWSCTAVMARAMSLPVSLENLSKFLGLTKKLEDGKRLIHTYCMPDKKGKLINKIPTTDVQAFLDYCETDVKLCKKIYETLPKIHDDNRYLGMTYQMDSLGLPVDMKLVNKCVNALEKESAAVVSEMSINVRSPSQILDFCKSEGVNLPSATKDTVRKYLESDTTPKKVKDVLRAREKLSLSSVAKYKKIQKKQLNNRIHDCFCYYGTITGRDSGKTIQPQNLPRGSRIAYENLPYIDTPLYELFTGFDVFKGAKEGLRAVIRPNKKDHTFFCADLASIELRVLLWLIGDKEKLEKIKAGVDLYKFFASKIYGKATEEITPEERTLGKASVLGLGYGMGALTFIATCKTMYGVNLTEEQARSIVNLYRKEFSRVKKYWDFCNNSIENAAKGIETKSKKLHFSCDHNFTLITLPSKRRLFYYGIKNHKNDLTYLAYSPTKTEGTGYQAINGNLFKQTKIYGGKIVENITQAVARDIFFNGCAKLSEQGFKIIGRFHDEVLCEVNKSADFELFKKTFKTVPPWASDLPVDVSAWCGTYYRK